MTALSLCEGTPITPMPPRRGRPIGRPSKLTDDVRRKIAAAIKTGNYSETAAASAGIGKTTFYQWMLKGETLRGKYGRFREAVKAAEAAAEVSAVTILRKAMPKDWRAVAFYLERKYQARWGHKEQHEITGKDGQPIVVTFGGRYKPNGAKS